MNEENITNNEQRRFYKQIETYTDRELIELQAFFALQSRDNIKSIKLNVQIFLYLIIFGLVLSIILMNQQL